MNSNLNKLTKKELLNIVSKMKKEDLVHIIENKIGGGNETIIKQTNNAIRKTISFNKNKANKISEEIAMANNKLYNEVYEEDNNYE